MFIKKDLRKVQEILEDEEDDRRTLKLARREAQFDGKIEVLARARHRPALKNCEYLSLYNNKLRSIRGIDAFQDSPLEALNLGRNELERLSSGLGALSKTLQRLWVEDNMLKGFPRVRTRVSEFIAGSSLHLVVRQRPNACDKMPLSCMQTNHGLFIFAGSVGAEGTARPSSLQ